MVPKMKWYIHQRIRKFPVRDVFGRVYFTSQQLFLIFLQLEKVDERHKNFGAKQKTRNSEDTVEKSGIVVDTSLNASDAILDCWNDIHTIEIIEDD